jgi:starch-binding outer membrane protein SusE/F
MAPVLLSCEKDEDRAILGQGTPSTLTVSSTDLVLSRDQMADTVVTFQWLASTFGYDAAVKYTLQFDTASSFATAKEVAVGGDLSKAYTVGDLNTLALSMGLPAGVSTPVQIRVKSEVGTSGTAVYSDAQTVNVNPFALSASLYVPGDHQGWNPAAADSVFSASGNGIFEGYVYFGSGSGKFKLTSHRDWDHTNYGDGGAGKISTTGGDLSVAPPGYYLLKVNTNDLTWSATKTDWGLIGDATGSWDADKDLSYNAAEGVWEITTNLTPGAIKFRANDAWAINLGDSGADGSLEYDGANINVTEAGNYTIALDLRVPGQYGYTVTKN